MVYANAFKGKNDSEILNKAIESRGKDGIVVISPREIDNERDYWLLDEAVLLPENTTVVLQNVKIKLSDRCRDNFFRTANCGLGIEYPTAIRNVHIKGEGECLLEGADHPRATGDSSKPQHVPCSHFPEDVCKYSDWIDENRRHLDPKEFDDICKVADWVPESERPQDRLNFWDVHDYSYGTDCGKEGESQYGDWRGIGILFANVDNFSISGVRIKDSHGWCISLEACTNGRVEKIDFDCHMHKMIDGMYMNMENQDGVDVRNGCHHIIISDITGFTGDDVIALTAIAKPNYIPGGSFRSTHVMHNDWSRREKDIHDIIIRNVAAHSHLCYTVRLLPALTNIYNVVIDGIIDTNTDPKAAWGTLLLGENDGNYGENSIHSMRNISISNVICNSNRAIHVKGYLTDSVINNVINRNPERKAFYVEREDGLKNVAVSNVVEASK